MVDVLADWFDENRRDLPWRRTYDPYHIWVSEVMLQQTQVETVIPYYEQFIGEFPSVENLACATEDRVLQVWAGLGYYARARNLLLAARKVSAIHHGRVPDRHESLTALPGIGRYMAGAILSIAFNQPFPAVDGNVRRVLSRVHGWTDDNPKRLWDRAAQLVRSGEPRTVNQALMELGATVCSFRAPRCLLCPIHSGCVAFQTGMQTDIPPVRKRPQSVHVLLHAVVEERNGMYLMKPSEGLWEFPMFAELPEGSFREVGTCRHTITHHQLRVVVHEGILHRQSGFQWTEFAKVPVSSLTRKIRDTVTARP